MTKNKKAKVAHTSKTQSHIRTCGSCNHTGGNVIVVLLLYIIEKSSGALGQGRVKVHRCPKCLG